MIGEAALIEAARALDEAEASRTPIPPLSATIADLDEAGAYGVQQAWVAMKLARGRALVGHKIGLTSRAMQRLVAWDEPDYGALLDDMVFEDGAELSVDRFITPMVECELAFMLARPLRGTRIGVAEVLAATEYIQPALEIVDLRTLAKDPASGRARAVLDNIADNAANAALVIGGRPVRPDAFDLRWVGAICRRGLVIEQTGLGAAVLNHPARGVAWLARKLAEHGAGLEAGQIVLCGSFTGVVDARRGDVFTVDYGPLGTVACSFV